MHMEFAIDKFIDKKFVLRIRYTHIVTYMHVDLWFWLCYFLLLTIAT